MYLESHSNERQVRFCLDRQCRKRDKHAHQASTNNLDVFATNEAMMRHMRLCIYIYIYMFQSLTITSCPRTSLFGKPQIEKEQVQSSERLLLPAVQAATTRFASCNITATGSRRGQRSLTALAKTQRTTAVTWQAVQQGCTTSTSLAETHSRGDEAGCGRTQGIDKHCLWRPAIQGSHNQHEQRSQDPVHFAGCIKEGSSCQRNQ